MEAARYAGAARWDVTIRDKEGEEGCQVLLVSESDGLSIPCDGCKDLDVSLCMEYCREIDDLGKIINAFEEKRKRKKRL